MRIADPTPGFCSVCFAASPERRFIDASVDFDGAPVLDRDSGSIAVLPWTGEMATHQSLFICEPCVQQMCEEMGLKAERNGRQLREIRRLELERDHWKATARRFQDELNTQLESAFGPATRGPGRPRKVAV